MLCIFPFVPDLTSIGIIRFLIKKSRLKLYIYCKKGDLKSKQNVIKSDLKIAVRVQYGNWHMLLPPQLPVFQRLSSALFFDTSLSPSFIIHRLATIQVPGVLEFHFQLAIA
jgi:hypothetical protein